MKTIIAGSRTITDYAVVEDAVASSCLPVTHVLCGLANGVDKLGEQFALKHHLPVSYYSPDWVQYGKRAGFIRNRKMAENAEALIAVWDGLSCGTRHMIATARELGLKVYVHPAR